MSNLNEFRAELKGKVIDFATVYQISSKDAQIDKSYEKLEKYILESFNTWLMDGVKKVDVEPAPNPEDTTLQLDF